METTLVQSGTVPVSRLRTGTVVRLDAGTDSPRAVQITALEWGWITAGGRSALVRYLNGIDLATERMVKTALPAGDRLDALPS